MASPEEIRRAAEIIRSGGLVAFPTETVYGLGANAFDARAVARIFQAKGRPRTSPLIVHVCSVEMAQEVVSHWPPQARDLAERFWPGPLSLVLPRQEKVPEVVTAGLPTVGVRVPRHPVALDLIRMAGTPIAAPSANPFTRLSPTRGEHVRLTLANEVDMLLEGGSSSVGIESTVLGLEAQPVLLRPGAVSREQLEAVIGPLQAFVPPQGDQGHSSPGQHQRHYQPVTDLVVSDEKVGGRYARVWWNNRNGAESAVQLPAEPAGFAAALYDTLHSLDSKSFDLIQVEPVPEDSAWEAVRDRLRRAQKH